MGPNNKNKNKNKLTSFDRPDRHDLCSLPRAHPSGKLNLAPFDSLRQRWGFAHVKNLLHLHFVFSLSPDNHCTTTSSL